MIAALEQKRFLILFSLLFQQNTDDSLSFYSLLCTSMIDTSYIQSEVAAYPNFSQNNQFIVFLSAFKGSCLNNDSHGKISWAARSTVNSRASNWEQPLSCQIVLKRAKYHWAPAFTRALTSWGQHTSKSVNPHLWIAGKSWKSYYIRLKLQSSKLHKSYT